MFSYHNAAAIDTDLVAWLNGKQSVQALKTIQDIAESKDKSAAQENKKLSCMNISIRGAFEQLA
jgi:hypothetical protein